MHAVRSGITVQSLHCLPGRKTFGGTTVQSLHCLPGRMMDVLALE